VAHDREAPQDETRQREIEFENQEWLNALDFVHQSQGGGRVCELLRLLQIARFIRGISEALEYPLLLELDK
jgi:hypothetical protein